MTFRHLRPYKEKASNLTLYKIHIVKCAQCTKPWVNNSQKTQYCQYVWFDNICFMRLNKYDMGPHSRTTIGAKIECGCTESSKGAHSTMWMHTTKYGCTQSSKDSQSTIWVHTAQCGCTQSRCTMALLEAGPSQPLFPPLGSIREQWGALWGARKHQIQPNPHLVPHFLSPPPLLPPIGTH